MDDKDRATLLEMQLLETIIRQNGSALRPRYELRVNSIGRLLADLALMSQHGAPLPPLTIRSSAYPAR